LAHVYCGQTAGWIKMPLGTEVNLGPGDVVLDGVAAPPRMGTAPQFSFHVYCGQTAGWMKTPLGTEVVLGRGHVVLDGDPAPLRKGHSSPLLFLTHCPSRLLLSSCTAFVLHQKIVSTSVFIKICYFETTSKFCILLPLHGRC